jgi:6-phosphogluconolactonase (cycloisomerase 2 family)
MPAQYFLMARWFVGVGVAGALAACSGGGGGGPASYSVGGNVAGLSGTGLVLMNNGGDALSVSAAGPFTFATKVASGKSYGVSVSTQPSNPTQTCTVSNGTGTVSGANVTSVAVQCATATHPVGGTISGLTGTGLSLQNNGGDQLAISADGSFHFATEVAEGAPFHVTVVGQPTSPVQNCTLTNGTARGTVSTSAVMTVSVVCANVGRFLYTANLGDYTISAFAIDSATGALKAMAGSPYGGTVRASYVAADPAGRFLYALDNGTGALGIAASGIDMFSIDPKTGALTASVGNPFATDAGASSLFVEPGGNRAYTANVNSMSVSGYAIDTAADTITPLVGSPYPGGQFPMSIASDPDGKFAFTPNNTGDVSSYTIDAASGALKLVTGSPFTAGSGSSGVAVDASGKYVFVANEGTNDVSVFTINATTGVLTEIAGSPYKAGINAAGVAVDPSGSYLFVANANGGGTPGANTVSVFSIDASTGKLTAVPGSPYATSTLSVAISIDPSGKFVYIANGDPPANNISAFAIDVNTGALTAVPGSPFATGPNPQSLVVSK